MRLIKRLPIIRHVRYFFLVYEMNRHIEFCRRAGLGWFAQQSDLDYLDLVWRGEA